MKKFVSTIGMKHEEWLAYRKSGIGGSDAGAICGLNPYASPMSVYYDKTNPDAAIEDNEAMRQGRDLEEYVAIRFMEETGLKVRRSNAIYQHSELPFVLANVDRMVVGEFAGLECKTVSPYSADKWKDGEVPAHYLLQCMHYMATTGAKAWYLAALIFGQEFKYIRIERDEEQIRDLMAIESHFWNHYVVPGILPEPDGSKACDEIIKQYYPSARKGEAIPLIGFDEKLRRREEIGTLVKKLETESQQIEQEIKLYMKEAETACSERYRVSWSSYETVRLDSKRLKSELPEAYQKFSGKSQNRRFVVNVA